ncbi:uncharacterized protein LOC106160152 isoform X1 [Lingula anatina]|uniref:Uncharacterized protein LOC106160152 isoform X1 n=2 Tax=Lingula anatina TaxID=7574 RepID=A0A1S3I438_LINAN|nr:uncharacterized protein LOC106160152 isoform X1 [Lingula anatina]|eukprot:XP_013392124.1 uncharacterized protein LOC106160152 isoform X1 [Lingula anatina]
MSVKLVLELVFVLIARLSWAQDCTPLGFPHLKCTASKNCLDAWISNLTNNNFNPSAPTELTGESFLKDYVYKGRTFDNYPAFNITWKAADNAGFRYTKGFKVTILFLNGYRVNENICRFYNMTDAVWNDADHMNQPRPMFHFFINNLPESTDCWVQVCSLPMPSPDRTQPCVHMFQSTLAKDKDPNTLSGALWYTTIRLQIKSAELEVYFQPKSDIIVYDVELLHNETSKKIKSNDVYENDPRTYFPTPCPGRYKIWVTPKHTMGKLNNRCVCTNTGNTCENHCTTTSLEFEIKESDVSREKLRQCNLSVELPPSTAQVPKIVSKSPTPGGSSNDWTTGGTTNAVSPKVGASKGADRPSSAVVPAVLGVLGAMMLLGVAALLYWWRRRPGYRISSGDSEKPLTIYPNNKPKDGKKIPLVTVTPNPNPQTRITMPDAGKQYFEISKTKTVFLVYSDDHERHREVVIKFANFLKFQCGCDVILDLWSHHDIMCEMKTGWLTKSCDRADIVLIINSEGAYKRFRARQNGEVYDKLENQSPTSDMYLQVITMIRERYFKETTVPCAKYVNVHFGYTPDTYIIPDIQPKFLLMNHMESLFFHIHGIEQYQPGSKYTVEGISDLDYYSQPEQNPEGVKLYQAIREAENYFSENKNWFSERYGKPTPVSVPRLGRSSSLDPLDSGLESLRPENREELHTGCHDNTALMIDEGLESRPQLWIPPTELQRTSPEDFLGPASPTPEAFQSPPSFHVAQSLNARRQQQKQLEDNNLKQGQGHPVSNGCVNIPSLKDSQLPNGHGPPKIWIPPTVSFDAQSNGCPQFIPPDDSSHDGDFSPYEPLATPKFIPPVFPDNASATFSEQVRNINEAGYDDFDTLVDSGDLSKPAVNITEETASVESIGGVSL